ncbi:MAG: hypothetical protein K1000chlam3_01203 [Chlamydiae bacterium]|nr:hypothetical protein [Chlamydiota bacterium]
MENITVKHQRLNSFIENVGCIADEKYQERVWVRAEGPECDDIDDTVCDFFDDGDPILEKYKDFGINENQYKLLMILHQKLREFTDKSGLYSPEKSTEKLIQLPQWQEIRNIAKKVIMAFDFKKQ